MVFGIYAVAVDQFDLTSNDQQLDKLLNFTRYKRTLLATDRRPV